LGIDIGTNNKFLANGRLRKGRRLSRYRNKLMLVDAQVRKTQVVGLGKQSGRRGVS